MDVATLRASLARRFAIDRRALAAFRIALGLLLLVNLLLRARYLRTFYTDGGVLPRAALRATHGAPFEVFAILGDPWLQVLLFPIAGLFALALVVGYRTRVATACSLALLMLLHLRNPLILNSGDVLLRALLLWGLFLPLGDRWALDTRDGRRSDGTITSIATAAVLVQIVLMYAVNAVHKSHSEEWLSGEAVAYVFQADQLTFLLGDVLAGYPPLLEAITYLWLTMVFVSPLLVVLRGRTRAALTTLFVGMHLGMFVTMPIGLFPLVAVAGLLLFYPPIVWDGAERLIGRTDLAVGARGVGDSIGSILPRKRSLNLLDGRPRLQRLYAGGQLVLGRVLPAVLLMVVLLSGLQVMGAVDLPDQADETIDTVNLRQEWGMFAPNPAKTTRWVDFPAERVDGKRVDAFRGGSADLERPGDVAATYPSNRWRKYLRAIQFKDPTYRPYFGAYLCERYNRTHEVGIERVSVVVASEQTNPYTGDIEASGTWTVFEYDCQDSS